MAIAATVVTPAALSKSPPVKRHKVFSVPAVYLCLWIPTNSACSHRWNRLHISLPHPLVHCLQLLPEMNFRTPAPKAHTVVTLTTADHEAVIIAYEVFYAGYEAALLAVGQKSLCAALISNQKDPESDAFANLRASAVPVLALQVVIYNSPVFVRGNGATIHVAG